MRVQGMHTTSTRHHVILAALLLGIVSTGCTAAATGETGGGDQVAYQYDVPGERRIGILLLSDDHTPVPLGADTNSGLERHPDWSPDGRQLVFTAANAAGTDDLWIADADGADAVKVQECTAPCLGVDEAAWSPDGTRIVFQRLVQEHGVVTSTLELLDVGSGDATVVLTAPPNSVVLAPRWSPDGQHLVVEHLLLDGPAYDDLPIGDRLELVDLGAAVPELRPLTDAAEFGNNPDWSPTAPLIVFAAQVPGSTLQDLFVMAPDGTQRRRLTTLADNGDLAVQPTFSPDGRTVLFVRRSGRQFTPTLMEVAVDGGPPVALGGATEVRGEHPRRRPAS